MPLRTVKLPPQVLRLLARPILSLITLPQSLERFLLVMYARLEPSNPLSIPHYLCLICLRFFLAMIGATNRLSVLEMSLWKQATNLSNLPVP